MAGKSGWSGGGIVTFQRALTGLKNLPEAVFKDMATDISKDMQRNYDAGKDPYGNAWKPRKQEQPWPIMKKSGRLYKSLDVKVKDSGITIKRGQNAPYGAFHQSGTKFMPVRLIVPIHAQGLPLAWRMFFQSRVSKRFKALF